MTSLQKVGIVCCSNAQLREYEKQNDDLSQKLLSLGYQVVFSKYIYADTIGLCGSAKDRALSLMDFYKDDSIKAILDISGGDVANEILDFLDFDVIARSNKPLWGYSDITTVINAIFAMTGKTSVLYQIKNLVYEFSEQQQSDFEKLKYGNDSLFDFKYKYIQGHAMQGTVIGGNIRCFLKLAGTKYFPNVTDKILLLESLGGEVPQMITYLSQLKQIGVFNKISGIILGTFTRMEKANRQPSIRELITKYVDSNMPVVQTNQIGHAADSKAIIIGKHYKL